MVSKLFREVDDILRTEEWVEPKRVSPERPRVACLGPEFSHSYDAAFVAFPRAEIFPCLTFGAVFSKVFEEGADRGLIPVENSVAGSVWEPLHELFDWTDRGIFVCGDHHFRIRNFVAAKRQIPIASVSKVLTKDEAARQCSDWLSKHGLEVEQVGSTSAAARMVAESERDDVIAIASLSAIQHYGLVPLVSQPITDDPTNTTRFLEIHKGRPKLQGRANVVVILFVVLYDVPGALFEFLGIFAKEQINLRSLTKAPMRRRIANNLRDCWYVELEIQRSSGGFERAFRTLDSRRDIVPVVKLAGVLPPKSSRGSRGS